MKTLWYLFTSGMLMMIFYSCNKEEVGGKAPQNVQIIHVENEEGLSRIYYALPSGTNVEMISAAYILDNGTTEIKRFNIVDHPEFIAVHAATETPINVAISTFNINGLESDKTAVQIHPTFSISMRRLKTLYETLDLEPIIRGVRVSYGKVLDEDIIKLQLFYKDGENWVKHKGDFELESEVNSLVIKDLSSYSEYKISVTNQYDEILSGKAFEITPIEEFQLSKGTWTEYWLPGDMGQFNTNTIALRNMWDGLLNHGVINTPRYDSRNNLVLPAHIAVDLGAGQNLKISSLRLDLYAANSSAPSYEHIYNALTPRHIEIYGSNNLAADGSWDNWQLMATHEVVKPSGYGNPKTDADLQHVHDGEFILISEELAAYRYIRLKINSVFADTPTGTLRQIRLSELTIWGVVTAQMFSVLSRKSSGYLGDRPIICTILNKVYPVNLLYTCDLRVVYFGVC